MIKVKIDVNAPASVLWDVIVDYERYPEFLKDLKKVKIIKTEGNAKTVHHDAEIIKAVWYDLVLVEEEKNKKLSWKLIDSSTVSIAFFKIKLIEKNDGWWDITETAPGKCTATYNLDIVLNSKIPSSLTDPVVKKNLPATMEAFKARAESLAKK